MNPASARPVATPDHVLLRHTDVEESVREPFRERFDDGEAEIAGEQDDPVIRCREVAQGLDERRLSCPLDLGDGLANSSSDMGQ